MMYVSQVDTRDTIIAVADNADDSVRLASQGALQYMTTGVNQGVHHFENWEEVRDYFGVRTTKVEPGTAVYEDDEKVIVSLDELNAVECEQCNEAIDGEPWDHEGNDYCYICWLTTADPIAEMTLRKIVESANVIDHDGNEVSSEDHWRKQVNAEREKNQRAEKQKEINAVMDRFWEPLCGWIDKQFTNTGYVHGWGDGSREFDIDGIHNCKITWDWDAVVIGFYAWPDETQEEQLLMLLSLPVCERSMFEIPCILTKACLDFDPDPVIADFPLQANLTELRTHYDEYIFEDNL